MYKRTTGNVVKLCLLVYQDRYVFCQCTRCMTFLIKTMTTIASIAHPWWFLDFHLKDRNACADKCIEYDWLHQGLPSWDSGRRIKTPGTTQKERFNTPAKVEFWDVEGDIKAFLEKADRVKWIFQKVDNQPATIGTRNMHHVAGSVLSSTCIFVNKKRSGSSVIYETEATLPTCSAEGGDSEDGNPQKSDKPRSEDREVAKCLYYGKSPRADILVKSNDRSVATRPRTCGFLLPT